MYAFGARVGEAKPAQASALRDGPKSNCVEMLSPLHCTIPGLHERGARETLFHVLDRFHKSIVAYYVSC